MANSLTCHRLTMQTADSTPSGPRLAHESLFLLSPSADADRMMEKGRLDGMPTNIFLWIATVGCGLG